MPPPADRVWTLATEVRDAVIDGYALAAVELPERRFVAPGVPPYDCELLAVQVERTYGHEGNVAAESPQAITAHPAHALRGVGMAVHIIRCVPMVDSEGDVIVLPTVADEEVAAQVILTDAQLLLNVLVAAQKAGDLPGCNSLVFDQWVSVGPQGGLGGGILRLRLTVGA